MAFLLLTYSRLGQVPKCECLLITGHIFTEAQPTVLKHFNTNTDYIVLHTKRHSWWESKTSDNTTTAFCLVAHTNVMLQKQLDPMSGESINTPISWMKLNF